MTSRVVHCKREPYDVYIGRPSKWGNPFAIGKDGDRDTVISKYRDYIAQRPELLSCIEELRGKTLGCWCAPNRCHGDVLLELLRHKDRTRAWASLNSITVRNADGTSRVLFDREDPK